MHPRVARARGLSYPEARQPRHSPSLFREPEAVLQRKIVELAKLYGWRCYWTHNSRRSPGGFPDLVLTKVYPNGVGRCVIAELKAEDGRFRPGQREWLADLRACDGLEVYVWTTADWAAEILKVLSR